MPTHPAVRLAGLGPVLAGIVALVGGVPAVADTAPTGLAFTRTAEPNEHAFTLLTPRGWQARGGIFRVDAATAGGPLNALAAKCDLAFTSDQRGTVMFHILPDMVYAHVGIGGGYWPPGSVYQGAVVRPLESAEQHLMSLFQHLHPRASEVQVVASRRLPGEVEALDRAAAYTNQLLGQVAGPGLQSRHDAAAAVIDYTEQGVRYRQIMGTGLVNEPAAMTWRNTRTLEFRAPAAEFERWRPVFDVMRFSVRFDPRWILKESNNQRQQADFVMKVLDEVRRIDGELAAHTRVTHAEIMNDNFLVLTGQEEFVDPRTGEVEVDTDAFRYRWKTDGGDVYYTVREDEDPNLFLQRTDYERTPVRQR
ncbi:MAG: hypothetical protein R3D98_02025 [Candidatus Krumholzibacteriia bacterium]